MQDLYSRRLTIALVAATLLTCGLLLAFCQVLAPT